MVRLVTVATGALLLGAGEVIQEGAAEELAAPKFLASPPGLSAALPPLYQCTLGAPSTWSEPQQSWCCEHQRVGCPSTSLSLSTRGGAVKSKASTTPEAIAKGPKLWSWGGDYGEASSEATTKKATTTTRASTSTTPAPTTTSLPPTTTTPPPTTTTHTCEELCTVAGVTASCKDHIQQASLSDFLGLFDSCSRAQANIADQCPLCAGCPPQAVGCGVLDPPTTTGPTTTIPQGDPCNAVCNFGELPATCNARVKWSLEHVFDGKPHPCSQAHDLVLRQCDVCSLCELGETDCGQAAPTNEDRLFDCAKGATMEWSQAKQVWCCEHEQKACDLTGDKQQVFFQKNAEMEAVAADARSALPLMCAVGFVGLVAGIALLHRGRRLGTQSEALRMGFVE